MVDPPLDVLIKVCCIQDETELRAAAASGATHVGLVGAMPSGPGPIADDAIRRLASIAPPHVTPVLLTSRPDAAGIVEHVRSTGVGAVQIVRHVDAEVRRLIRTALPDVPVLQVIHVEDEESVRTAVDGAEEADYLLLDSGRPGAATPELGGTGRPHDWALSRRIVQEVDVPVFLAGGLRPVNVADAVARVRPAGVDACSGLRDDSGRLSAPLLHDFVRTARACLGSA